jgi:UDPglucose 6-dehydrogenase
VNEGQRDRIYRRLCDAIGPANGTTPAVAVLGLAFKPNTDDLRDSPAVDIAARLAGSGIRVRVHDPVALANARIALPEVQHFEDAYEAVADCDAVLLATEWDEYRQLDWSRIRNAMHGRVIVDSRNALDGSRLEQLGFHYISVGRRARKARRHEPSVHLQSGAAGGS